MNPRFSSLKVKPPILIVIVLAIILGIIAKLIIIGGLLRAQEDTTLVEVINSNQTMMTKDTQISDDPAMITIRSNENRLLVLPASDDYAISFSEDGREQPIPLYPADSFVQDEELLRLGIGELPTDIVAETTDQTTDGTAESISETLTAETVELATASDVIQVTTAEEPSQAVTYLRLVKDQPITLVFREPTKDMSIVLTDVYSQNYQTLFQWLLPEETTNETMAINEPHSEENVVEEEPTEGTAETAQDESTDATEVPDQEEQTEATEMPDQEEPSNSSPPPFEADTSYENILVVETEETDLELDELLAGDYQEEDSLVTPRLAADAAEEINATTTNPITFSDAKLLMATGSESFDDNDDPGYDSSPDNNIVRSNDQIFYRLGFSIQSLPTSNYTNIRYRVISTLPNTSSIVNGTPFTNGEIINGTLIESGQEDGTVISQGVMESSIYESGQIFIPIIIDVYGAANGTVMKPTFELQLIDAFNEDTNQVETFNQTYTYEQLPALDVPETIVSSTASISAELVRGETTDYQIYDPDSTEEDFVYNLGLVIKLNNLPDRTPGDIRGSAYPQGPISFDLDQQVTSTTGGSTSSVDPSLYDMAQTQFYSVTNADRSAANWQATSAGSPYEATFDPLILQDPLPIPHGKTETIYYSEPTSNRSSIGVYDSGNIAITLDQYKENWVISNYTGTKNPYTFDTLGNSFDSSTFISAEFMFNWNDERLRPLMIQNGWNYYTLNLSITSLTYDGKTAPNDTSLRFSSFSATLGAMVTGPNIVSMGPPDPITGIRQYLVNQDLGFGDIAYNVGQPVVMRGQQTYLGGFFVAHNVASQSTAEHILEWNSNGFEYDLSRQPYLQSREPDNSERSYLTYGVRINGEAMPSLVVPHHDAVMAAYTWYNTPQEALANGPISAVRFSYTTETSDIIVWKGVPVRVVGDPGALDEAGDPYVLLSSGVLKRTDGSIYRKYVPDPLAFYPATWNADGTGVTSPFSASLPQYAPYLGTNAFILDFGIETSTEISKSLYQTEEYIDIKVRGTLTGAEESLYDTALNTTLPIGIDYLSGSAKDAYDQPLPDPFITQNSDGSTTLRWVFPDSSLETGTEVNFLATSDASKLTFNDLAITPSLVVRTVGEMWISDEPSIQDIRSEQARASQDQFVEQLIQKLSLNKRVDKVAIEEGNHEMAPLTQADAETAFTYTITATNSAAQLAQNFRLLDVLPYNGDSRGSSFNGTLAVASVSVDTTGDYRIYYTTDEIDDTTNPNAVDLASWSQYTPGSSSPNEIQQARAIMLTKDNLGVGETVTLSITVQPDGQLAGDHYENIATMNAYIDLPVDSQLTVTHVYGRDLSGFVWKDSNRDGLYNNNESLLADIPVKLYRTSLLHPDQLTDTLVEHDLKGNVLIDELGNSTVITDAEGKYHFSYLPEGNYVVEFQIEGEVLRREIAVTTPMVGSDPAINSKANQTTFRTDEYLAEPLENLPGMTTNEDPIFHIPYLNLGILSTIGEIYLYKFETGTTQDEDNDGQPDINDENQLVAGTKLAGAEFVLQEKESGDTVQTMMTDANGRIYFEDVPFGEYELIETKAPEGYELLKQSIEVTVDENNTIVHLFAEDDLITELPFAGNNSMIQRVLIVAASLSLIGLMSLGAKYSWDEMKRKKEGGKKDG